MRCSARQARSACCDRRTGQDRELASVPPDDMRRKLVGIIRAETPELQVFSAQEVVHVLLSFIINEHGILLNMPQRHDPVPLPLYRDAIHRWLPKAKIRPARPGLGFDDVITWAAPDHGTLHYLVEEKRHLRHQDIAVVVERLNRRRATLPPAHADHRFLVVAPHIRAPQAAALERAGIDYLDLAGNVHLTAPGWFVHVVGQRPPKQETTVAGPAQKGWVRTVMALLIRPDLADVPYRELADHAGVALGTVAKCLKDIERRGFFLDGRQGRRINDRQALTALWVQAYVEGLRPKLTERRFQVRARNKQEIWQRVTNVLAARRERWALTGADAAALRTQFFRAEETEIYAPPYVLEDRDAQKDLVAQPAGRGGNLLVIEPPGPLALPDAATADIPVAPDLLTYAELRYRGTEQAIEAAERLLPKVLDDAAN